MPQADADGGRVQAELFSYRSKLAVPRDELIVFFHYRPAEAENIDVTGVVPTMIPAPSPPALDEHWLNAPFSGGSARRP